MTWSRKSIRPLKGFLKRVSATDTYRLQACFVEYRVDQCAVGCTSTILQSDTMSESINGWSIYILGNKREMNYQGVAGHVAQFATWRTKCMNSARRMMDSDNTVGKEGKSDIIYWVSLLDQHTNGGTGHSPSIYSETISHRHGGYELKWRVRCIGSSQVAIMLSEQTIGIP